VLIATRSNKEVQTAKSGEVVQECLPVIPRCDQQLFHVNQISGPTVRSITSLVDFPAITSADAMQRTAALFAPNPQQTAPENNEERRRRGCCHLSLRRGRAAFRHQLH